MQTTDLFQGVTLAGNNELEIILELLENAWKDELIRISSNKANQNLVDTKTCTLRYEHVKSIGQTLASAIPVPTASYQLSALMNAIAAKNPAHLSKSKRIDVQLTWSGKTVNFSATGWGRMHGEIYREINKLNPAGLPFLVTNKPLGLRTSATGMIRPFPVDGDGSYYLETNFSNEDTLKKIRKLAVALGLKPKDLIFTA